MSLSNPIVPTSVIVQKKIQTENYSAIDDASRTKLYQGGVGKSIQLDFLQIIQLS